MTLGQYPEMSFADARSEAEIFKRDLKGVDPLIVKQRQKRTGIISVDDLFENWYKNELAPSLKHPDIPESRMKTGIAILSLTKLGNGTAQ